jgi:hypothetical protein
MNGWQLRLYYKRAFLNCTAAVEGPFLNESSPGSTIFSGQIDNAYNSTHGRISAYCAVLGSATASGSGVLATITFKATSKGTTLLHFTDTILSDQNSQPIPHTIIDGIVSVVGDDHDIAVAEIVTSKTGCTPRPTVGRGSTMRINVTIENQGNFSETSVISAYANLSLIGSVTVTDLPRGMRTTVTFNWNTTNFNYGYYNMSAQASAVFQEQDIADNFLAASAPLTQLSILGDVDGDSKVTILDVVKITGCYSSRRGEPLFNPNSDLDENDLINILDVVKCTGHYGEKYP